MGMKTKRLLSFIFAMIMLATFLSAFSFTFAETYTGTCGDNVNWSLDTNTGALYIAGSGPMYNYEFVKPFGSPWRSENLNKNKIKTVTIAKGVTSIGDYAFYGCSLTKVTIPNSVKSIGVSAFQDCSNLADVAIPNSVTSIGEDAFGACESLTKVVVPDSVTELGSWVFSWCPNLKSITIGNGVRIIKEYAIYQCDSLTDVTIGNSVTYISNDSFSCCSRLKSITIPDGVMGMAPYAFAWCTGLESIVIPDSVTLISRYAFCDCENLSDVYYTGSEERWRAIEIGRENDPLLRAAIHYNYVPKPPIDPAKTFRDISKKAWYYDAVSYAVNHGLFAGANGKFDPDGDMTRGMFVSVLARMAGAATNNKVATKFTDVKKGQWYTGAVKWASENGIVSGSNGKFMPNDPITREQICTLIVSYAKFMKITLTPNAKAVTFKDAKNISKWAKSAVSACQKAGLIAGSNGNFDPKDKATRAAVAQILMQFDMNFGD